MVASASYVVLVNLLLLNFLALKCNSVSVCGTPEPVEKGSPMNLCIVVSDQGDWGAAEKKYSRWVFQGKVDEGESFKIDDCEFSCFCFSLDFRGWRVRRAQL